MTGPLVIMGRPLLFLGGGLNELHLILAVVIVAFVIYVAYRIGKVILRVFIGLTVLGLLSWGLWSLFRS